MSGELREGVRRIGSRKKPSRHWKPRVPYHIGVAQKTRKSLPVGKFDLAFSAIDDGLTKCDGKTNAVIKNLIVICVIVNVPPERVGVEAQLIEKALGGA